MKLYDFPLLADENIFRVLVDHLRNQDFDVVSIRELELLGIKDTDILTLANKNGRVVVTQDNDFGKIVFTKETDFIGIVYLRPGHFLPEKHIATIDAILYNNPELMPPFILTIEQRSDGTFRMRVRNHIYG